MKINFKKLILPASLFVAAQSHSLGLGNLQVNSALDETLKADISLMLGEGETVEDLSVYLASADDYRKVGLDKSFVPGNIQLEVVEQDNNKYIKLSSIGPIAEPIVSLLLVVDWKNGHLLREYTLLLDPPVFGTTNTISTNVVQTQTYNADNSIDETEDADVEDSSSTYSQPESQTIPTTVDDSSFESETVIVESGDTLWRIANRYTNSTTNPQQMMVAIFDENPTAFSNNDMNRLKKGARLTIPSSEVASSISFQQALTEVKAQIEQYQQATDSYSGSSDDSSSDIDYGIEIVPPRDSGSSDSDSSSSSSSSDSGSESLAELSRTKEELASVSLENQELSERVNDLEEIVKDQEVALQIKDDNLAQLQQQIGEQSLDNTISDPNTSEVDVTTVDDSKDDDLSDVEQAAEDQLAMNEDTEASDVDDVWGEDEVQTDDSTDELTTDIAQTDDVAEASDTSDNTGPISFVDDSKDTDTQTESTTPPVTPPPTRELSLMDKIMQYKMEGLIGLGALLAALLGFFFIRKRKSEQVDDGGSFLDSIGKNDSNDVDTLNDDVETETPDEDSLSDIIEDVDEAIESLDDDLEDVPAVTVMNEIDDEFDELDELVNDSEEVIDLVSDDSNDEFDLELDSTDDTDDFELSEDEAKNAIEDSDDETETLDLDDTESLDLDDTEFEMDEDLSVDDFNDELDSLIGTTNNDESSDNSTEVELGDDEFNNLMDEVDQDLNLDDISLEFDENSDENEKNSAEEFLEQDISLDLDLENDNAELDEVAEDSSDLEDLVFDTGEVKIINEDNINADQDDDSDIEIDHEDDIDIGLDLDELVTDDAVDTKLDLAKAYFEMGDLDGAMQMVTEIFEEGSEEQQTKAQELKDEIEKS